jgi:hypothetical protein
LKQYVCFSAAISTTRRGVLTTWSRRHALGTLPGTGLSALRRREGGLRPAGNRRPRRSPLENLSPLETAALSRVCARMRKAVPPEQAARFPGWRSISRRSRPGRRAGFAELQKRRAGRPGRRFSRRKSRCEAQGDRGSQRALVGATRVPHPEIQLARTKNSRRFWKGKVYVSPTAALSPWEARRPRCAVARRRLEIRENAREYSMYPFATYVYAPRLCRCL